MPLRALLHVFRRTVLSATLTARPAPRAIPIGACTTPTVLPVLLRLPASTRIDAMAPVETGRYSCRSLPDRSAACRRVGFHTSGFEACLALDA